MLDLPAQDQARREMVASDMPDIDTPAPAPADTPPEPREMRSSLDGDRFRAPKTADLVVRDIRKQIVAGDLAAGQLLPAESQLTRQLGVSRTALREAYRVLETEGLIRVRRGAQGGAVVHPPSSEAATRSAGLVLQYLGTTVSDVYDARMALEIPAVVKLARSHSETDIATLRTVADQATRSLDNPAESPTQHSGFHGSVVRLAGNPALILFWTMTDQIITSANRSFLSNSPTEAAVRDVHRAQRVHEKLIKLIIQGDVTAAQTLWAEHLEETAAMIRRESGPMLVIDLLG
jgi:GntR family transcriptional regulator, transcriptional repressor for pyruvate dehydrogenase complex